MAPNPPSHPGEPLDGALSEVRNFSLVLGGIVVPITHDVETHACFLLAAPVMIFTDLPVHERIRDIVMQFVE